MVDIDTNSCFLVCLADPPQAVSCNCQVLPSSLSFLLSSLSICLFLCPSFPDPIWVRLRNWTQDWKMKSKAWDDKETRPSRENAYLLILRWVSVSECACECMSVSAWVWVHKCECECVHEWEWVSARVSARVCAWLWVRGSEWVCEWVSECVLLIHFQNNYVNSRLNLSYIESERRITKDEIGELSPPEPAPTTRDTIAWNEDFIKVSSGQQCWWCWYW